MAKGFIRFNANIVVVLLTGYCIAGINVHSRDEFAQQRNIFIGYYFGIFNLTTYNNSYYYKINMNNIFLEHKDLKKFQKIIYFSIAFQSYLKVAVIKIKDEESSKKLT